MRNQHVFLVCNYMKLYGVAHDFVFLFNTFLSLRKIKYVVLFCILQTVLISVREYRTQLRNCSTITMLTHNVTTRASLDGFCLITPSTLNSHLLIFPCIQNMYILTKVKLGTIDYKIY